LTQDSTASLLTCMVNGSAGREIYPPSLHDALPISQFDRRSIEIGVYFPGIEFAMHNYGAAIWSNARLAPYADVGVLLPQAGVERSEEHTSELQSRENLVCRLLLEKKKENA